jgi:hypothetical protein
LDKYDEANLDDEVYEPITGEQRRLAEAQMKQRGKKKKRRADKGNAIGTRLPTAIDIGLSEEEEDEEGKNIVIDYLHYFLEDDGLKVGRRYEDTIKEEVFIIFLNILFKLL